MAFDLPATPHFARDTFTVSPANAEAFAAVEAWQDWPGGRMIVAGPRGTGKTHLAHIWCEMTGAERIEATELAPGFHEPPAPAFDDPALDNPALDDPGRAQASAAFLPDLARFGAVCVENADRIAGNPAAETALFHLHNMLVPNGRLLITAACAPRDWGLGLADLLSRMQAAPLARLHAPDDSLLAAVLAKLFADRQLAAPPNLIPYLLPRMFRSIAAARDLVAALDAMALAQGRPLSRALAAELLDRAERL